MTRPAPYKVTPALYLMSIAALVLAMVANLT